MSRSKTEAAPPGGVDDAASRSSTGQPDKATTSETNPPREQPATRHRFHTVEVMDAAEAQAADLGFRGHSHRDVDRLAGPTARRAGLPYRYVRRQLREARRRGDLAYWSVP